MPKDKKKAVITLDALALRVSPAVLAANPGVFGAPVVKQSLTTADGLVITLKGYAPRGSNSTRGAHWTTIAAARKRVQVQLAKALLNIGVTHPPVAPQGSRWRLHYVRHGVRELDGDNLAGAYKALQDAIVKIGLIQDDGWRILRSSHDQVKVKHGAEKTVVYFFRVPDDVALADFKIPL